MTTENTGNYLEEERERRQIKRFEIEAPDSLLDKLHGKIVDLLSITVPKSTTNEMWEIGHFRFGNDSHGNSDPLEGIRIVVIRDRPEYPEWGKRDEMNFFGFITTGSRGLTRPQLSEIFDKVSNT